MRTCCCFFIVAAVRVRVAYVSNDIPALFGGSGSGSVELEGDGTSHPGPPYQVQGHSTHPPTQSSVPPAAARLPNPSLKVPGTPEEALQRRTIFTRYSLLYIHDLIVNPKDYN